MTDLADLEDGRITTTIFCPICNIAYYDAPAGRPVFLLLEHYRMFHTEAYIQKIRAYVNTNKNRLLRTYAEWVAPDEEADEVADEVADDLPEFPEFDLPADLQQAAEQQHQVAEQQRRDSIDIDDRDPRVFDLDPTIDIDDLNPRVFDQDLDLDPGVFDGYSSDNPILPEDRLLGREGHQQEVPTQRRRRQRGRSPPAETLERRTRTGGERPIMNDEMNAEDGVDHVQEFHYNRKVAKRRSVKPQGYYGLLTGQKIRHRNR